MSKLGMMNVTTTHYLIPETKGKTPFDLSQQHTDPALVPSPAGFLKFIELISSSSDI